MGAICPKCGVHGAFVAAITATGLPAKKSREIIARRLACGHVIGNDDYMEYQKQLEVVEASEANAIRAIREKTEAARLEIWAGVVAATKEA